MKLLVPEEEDPNIQANDQLATPLVIFGATLILKLMERFPVIITIGAALIGLVAGEMLVGDIALQPWFSSLGVQYKETKPYVGGLSLELIAGAVGVVFVVVLAKWLAKRQERIRAPAEAERPNS